MEDTDKTGQEAKETKKKSILKRLQNKYLIVSVLFIVWLAFFDQNNLIDRYRYAKELRQLRRDMEYHKKQIQNINARLDELNYENENLVKFAREEYLMKNDHEDVFLILHDN